MALDEPAQITRPKIPWPDFFNNNSLTLYIKLVPSLHSHFPIIAESTFLVSQNTPNPSLIIGLLFSFSSNDIKDFFLLFLFFEQMTSRIIFNHSIKDSIRPSKFSQKQLLDREILIKLE